MDKFQRFYFDCKTKSAFSGARSRCNNSKNNNYARYGGRGIRFNITLADIQRIWLRDNAFDMDCPSIDRINNDGDYTPENCRFIEKKDNTARAISKPVKQYDEGHNLIARYMSISEASQKTGIPVLDITKNCRYEPGLVGGCYFYFEDEGDE
jgi:hypothetical protein